MAKLVKGDYVEIEYANDEDAIVCPICGFHNPTEYSCEYFVCENCDSQCEYIGCYKITYIGKRKAMPMKLEVNRTT